MARSGPVTLSIVVPTPDGGYLPALFDSLRRQLRAEDEVIVVGDIHSQALDEVRELVVNEGHRWLELDAGEHAWGHPQVNFGIEHALGDYLVFIDDDDIFTGDALTNIRRAARSLPEPCPMMFRFRIARSNMTLWQEKVIKCGYVGGHEFVVPNIPELLGQWTDRYEGDFDFISSTLAKWPEGSLVWREEIIALAR